MKKQKLTLKQLKADLDTLKKSKSALIPDVNKSRMVNIFKQSSMLHLWLITAILGYARKLPFISKIINMLSLWYGRTTWWQILGKLRKGFVICNALIGILIMFKAVGFSFDNILIGFMAMGHAYFEVLGNITNKIFNWLLNLFDHKIVPNVPNTKPSGGEKIKSVIDYINKPIEQVKEPIPLDDLLRNPIKREPYFSLREQYAKYKPKWSLRDELPIIEISPWYKDTSTWLYLIGIGCSLTVAYFGYKIYSDPAWIYSILTTPESVTVTPNTPKGPLPPLPPSPDITLGDNTSKSIGSLMATLGKGITNSTSYIRNKLNPFSYFSTTAEINNQFQTFMDYQSNPITKNRRLYPFTENNPYLPWYKKLKVAMFGEGTFDGLQRLKDHAKAEQWYEAIRNGKSHITVGATPADSLANTPLPITTPNAWSNIGVGAKPIFSSFYDNNHNLNIENKFKSITPIPKIIPTSVPITESILTDVTEWKNYNVETKTSIADTSDFIKNWKADNIASSSKVTLEQMSTPEVLETIENSILNKKLN